MKTKGDHRKKKPYRSPQLVTYGDFRSLTRVSGGKGGTKNDGTGAPRSRL